VAALGTPARRRAPTALDDLPGWAERCALAARYPESERTGQRHEERAGRTVAALDAQRAVLWGARIAPAAQPSARDVPRLPADPMAMTLAGRLAAHPAMAGVPRLEPGDHPAGEGLPPWPRWALAAGDGGLPVGVDVRPGGTGDRPTAAPPGAACSAQARLARLGPLEALLRLGDRPRPTADPQVTGWRLQRGSRGPLPLQAPHRQPRRDGGDAGPPWPSWPAVAQRESATRLAPRTPARGLGPPVTVSAPHAPSRPGSGRPLEGPARAGARRERARRHPARAAIEAALQRRQDLVHTAEAQTPERVPRRGYSKACKKRPAQPYCPLEVGSPADRPAAPLARRSRGDATQGQREAARAGGSLWVAGGHAAPLSEAERRAAGQGQDQVAPRWRLVPPLFVVTPWWRKTPPRRAARGCLGMGGALRAGRLERQGRRALAALPPPRQGLRPAGRDRVRPTVTRRCQACADDRLGQVQEAGGRVVERRLARRPPVQAPRLERRGLPQPAERWAPPVRVGVGAGAAWVGPRDGPVQGPGGGRTAHGRGGRGAAATALAGSQAAWQRAPSV